MQSSAVPAQYRRRRKMNGIGCNCDWNYARSPQGICKIIQLFLVGLAWIIIAASPYWRPIFVIGGQTWPFHVVMLLSVIVSLAVLFMYCLFVSGYHLSQGHRNWPKVELCFNFAMIVVVLMAACFEGANVWRWDMRQGSIYTAGGVGGSYSNYYQYGLRPGMSFTQTLNFNSYCSQRPYDCSDYFSLLAGNNSYYTNHLFAVVLLFFAVIAFVVSTFFAYRTWRVFERDMYKPGRVPKPSIWMRFTYQMEQASNNVREKVNKALKRGGDDNDEEDEGNGDVVLEVGRIEKASQDIESGFTGRGKEREKRRLPSDVESGITGRNSRRDERVIEKSLLDFEESVFDKRNSRSDGRESRARSHSSHHTSHSHRSRHSKSRSSHRGHDDRNERSSRSSVDRHSRSSSKPKAPTCEVPSPYDEALLAHPSPVGALPSFTSQKRSKKGNKEKDGPLVMSPVASVLI